MVLLLIFLSLYLHTSSGALIDFGIYSNEDPNQLFFECYVGPELRPQAGATYDFFNTLDDAINQNLRKRIRADPEDLKLQFTIDPSTEAYVRCSHGDDVSNLLAIAAEPSVPSSPENVKVFANNEATITCPFKLGLLHEDLDPYDISWVMVEGEETSPVDASISEEMFSIHRVPASELDNTTMYRCTLMLRRCEALDESNEPTEIRRCGLNTFTSPGIGITITHGPQAPTTDPPTNADAPATPGTPDSAIIAGIVVAGTILVSILLVIMLCYKMRRVQAKTALHGQDSVDKTEESGSHFYEEIDNIDHEHAHNTQRSAEGPAIDMNADAAGSSDVCPDAAVMTSPNQAYGCPIKKVDEGHTYKNVDLVEATTLFYTTSDGTRTYRPPEPATEVAAVSLSLEQPEVIADTAEHNQTTAANPSDDTSQIMTSSTMLVGINTSLLERLLAHSASLMGLLEQQHHMNTLPTGEGEGGLKDGGVLDQLTCGQLLDEQKRLEEEVADLKNLVVYRLQ